MRPEPVSHTAQRASTAAAESGRYEAPGYEVVCLACEISSYAPDGDSPLF